MARAILQSMPKHPPAGREVFVGPWQKAPASLRSLPHIRRCKTLLHGKAAALIFLPQGIDVDTPVEYTQKRNTPLLIAAAEHAQASLVIALQPGNHEIACIIPTGAKVSITCLARGKETTNVVLRSTVEKDSSLTLTVITRSPGKQEVHSSVTGRNGHASLTWITHATGAMTCDLSARTEFLAPHGSGAMTMRAVAEDRAFVRSRGEIAITKKGKGTKTRLTQSILLMDASARADAAPILTIETNDVEASHAASVSRIHPEDLFYLTSRGITEKQGRRMLSEGFLSEPLQELPERTRTKILQEVKRMKQ